MKPILILMISLLHCSFRGSVPLGQKFKTPVVIDFEPPPGGKGFLVTKEQENEIKKYYKENKLKVISKEEAQGLLRKQMAEILNPFIRTPPEGLERLKEEAKIKILNLPESSRWIHYTFYSADNIVLDSVLLTGFSSPYNAHRNVTFKKSIINAEKKEIISFLNIALDSCIANKFFD